MTTDATPQRDAQRFAEARAAYISKTPDELRQDGFENLALASAYPEEADARRMACYTKATALFLAADARERLNAGEAARQLPPHPALD